MARWFRSVHPDQGSLLPADTRSWLPPGHLAWQVLGAVGELDLSGFTAAYRADGQGQAPYDPAMMLALVLYCYFKGIRSSRKIAAACIDDVGCRVICGGAAPSHQAAAQFLRRHRAEVVRLFVQVLGLLAAAGAVEGRCAAVDGSPVSGNASRFANLDQEQLAARIAALQAAIDAAAQAWLAGAGEADGAGSQQPLWDDDDDDDDGPGGGPGGGVPRRLAVMAATLARLSAAQDKIAARRQAASPRSPDARIAAARDAAWQCRQAAGRRRGRPGRRDGEVPGRGGRREALIRRVVVGKKGTITFLITLYQSASAPGKWTITSTTRTYKGLHGNGTQVVDNYTSTPATFVLAGTVSQ